jgi:hypothetical protein
MTEDAKINYELQKHVGLQVELITKKRRRVIVRPNVDYSDDDSRTANEG